VLVEECACMYVIPSGGGCFCPVRPPVSYGSSLKEEEEWMPSLELISKEKNSFGDMYYYIRDQNGTVSHIYEENLEAFLKEKGVSELKDSVPFLYPQNKR
jgi:hypothetical protein